MRNAIGVFLFMLCVVFICGPVQAQKEIKFNVMWEYLTNNPAGIPGFPILKAKVGTQGESNGDSDMDLITSLRRYDENRLLLFVVENGIKESDPNHDKDLAQKFPDRTVWWINASDGSPIGIAITFPLKPWPDSPEYIKRINGEYADQSSTRPDLAQEESPKIEVDAEGNLYLSDKHHLLRYTPDGKGGFVGPELCYEYQPQDRSAVILPDGREGDPLHWRGFNMIDLQIKGVGQNKVMTTTRRHWADNGGVFYYTSNDGGKSWTPKHYNGQGTSLTGIGGGAGIPVLNPDGKEEWMFVASFPGSGDTVRQFVREAGTDNEFEELSNTLFTPGSDPDTNLSDTEKYMGWTKPDVAALDNIPYITVCTLPKWQSRNDATLVPAPTAWIAILSSGADPNQDGLEGDYVTAHKINFTETDEIGAPDMDGDNWQASYATEVNMYVGKNYPAGTFEILWSGGTMGYGRYIIGDLPVYVNDWNLY